MPEKINLKNVRGVTVHEVCDYCKGARRFPGGKYKDQGEVINCPICNGRGVTAVIISLSQFRTLMTMTEKRVKPRAWKPSQKPAKKRSRPKIS